MVQDQEFVERFIREARTLAGLSTKKARDATSLQITFRARLGSRHDGYFRSNLLRGKVIAGVACESPSMETNAHLRCTLNHLIQTCKDGQEGYLTAAENVSDAEAKRFFNECSLQRAKFTGELQTLVHELGDSNPEYASSVSGTLHRGWINLKSAILSGDAHAILLECERGEGNAVSEFKKALELALPANVREIVSKQCVAITAAHDRVRAMADVGAAHWL